ncbi:MAG: NADH-quinone oxidoreductase subunit N [Anaerolineales bacterium]|nr:NADH-quinone oxidoreductase subunit N [Anaerolineales bacterium]
MELGFQQLVPLLPALILITGGILILILDTMGGKKGGSGRGFMAITIMFLLVALVGVIMLMVAMVGGAMTPQTAMGLVDVDPFSLFLQVTVILAMLLVALAGGGFLNKRVSAVGEFWSSFLFVTAAMSFAVSANNLLLLFVSIEFLSITSYMLVGFVRDDLRSTEAGLKYFLYGSVASAVMLYGMTLLYGSTSSLSLPVIGKWLAENPQLAGVAIPATIMLMTGLGFKASLAPFFQWTPDTYEGAPTPVTAYLSTASKAVGFAVIARVVIVGLAPAQNVWVPVLGAMSVLTMFSGNLMALRQHNVKRMLAYSSIAQAGYMLLGLVAVVNPATVNMPAVTMNGLNGLLIYLVGYLFTNIGAFSVVTVSENQTGGSDYSHFNNLVKRSPGLATAMLIFLLSLVGIPLTAGFVGKFFVFGATVQHQYYFLAIVAIINVAISAFYYLNLARIMFFASEEENAPSYTAGAGIGAQAIVFLCVLGVFWIGIYPPNVIEWANAASQFLLTVMS